MSVLVSY